MDSSVNTIMHAVRGYFRFAAVDGEPARSALRQPIGRRISSEGGLPVEDHPTSPAL